MKHSAKATWGRNYAAHTSVSLSIIEGNQGKYSNRNGKQRPWRTHLVTIPAQEAVPLTMDWALPYQLMIRNPSL